MVNAAPLVSVALCSFNGARFIEEQLQSIIAQTYPIHEIIVVDDGSTDDTVGVVNRLAARHPSIRLYQNSENLGYNKNFEKALSLATGAVIAIADQDDLWHPEKIATMLRQWKKEAPLIYCNSARFDGQNPAHAQPNPWMQYFQGTDPRQLAVYNTVSGHAVLVRKELVQLAVPFDDDVYYDWWLAVVAACNGGVQFYPEVLVYQRLHGENASVSTGRTYAELHAYEKEMVLRNLGQFKKAPGMRPEHRSFFETLHLLWRDVMQGKSRKELFLFLMRHRQIIYSSKRRKVGFFSHVKRSLRYAYK